MREKYKNNIGYLFKKKQIIKGESSVPTWETEGIKYYYNLETITIRVPSTMAGVYLTATDEVQKTSSPINFEVGDRVANIPSPKNDVDVDDMSIIVEFPKKIPYNERGNKHRTNRYWEHWLKLN